MSIPYQVKVNCPKCHAAFSTTAWKSVNTDLSKELSEKIISGAFFSTQCSNCRSHFHLEYDVLYHDIKRRVMIWVLHTDKSDYRRKCEQIKSSPLLPDYKTRIVHDINALREKVAALEAGRDDRIIELYKIYLQHEVVRQYPGFRVQHAFYTYTDGEEIVFVYDETGKELHCNLDSEIYDTIASMFGEQFKEDNAIYAIYDAAWAGDAFLSLEQEESVMTEETQSEEPARNKKQQPVGPNGQEEQEFLEQTEPQT